MRNNIYQLALRCKNISDERIGTDRNLIPYRNILFTDYTVKGNVDEYREAIRDLQLAIAAKYSAISNELKLHNEEYGKSDKIVHYTAMKPLYAFVSGQRMVVPPQSLCPAQTDFSLQTHHL